MVEFEIRDYKTLVRWFELAFANLTPDKVSLEDKRTFWKLTFLCEDKSNDDKLNKNE